MNKLYKGNWKGDDPWEKFHGEGLENLYVIAENIERARVLVLDRLKRVDMRWKDEQFVIDSRFNIKLIADDDSKYINPIGRQPYFLITDEK